MKLKSIKFFFLIVLVFLGMSFKETKAIRTLQETPASKEKLTDSEKKQVEELIRSFFKQLTETGNIRDVLSNTTGNNFFKCQEEWAEQGEFPLFLALAPIKLKKGEVKSQEKIRYLYSVYDLFFLGGLCNAILGQEPKSKEALTLKDIPGMRDLLIENPVATSIAEGKYNEKEIKTRKQLQDITNALEQASKLMQNYLTSNLEKLAPNDQIEINIETYYELLEKDVCNLSKETKYVFVKVPEESLFLPPQPSIDFSFLFYCIKNKENFQIAFIGFGDAH